MGFYLLVGRLTPKTLKSVLRSWLVTVNSANSVLPTWSWATLARDGLCECKKLV